MKEIGYWEEFEFGIVPIIEFSLNLWTDIEQNYYNGTEEDKK